MEVTMTGRHLTLATVGVVVGILAGGATLLDIANAHIKADNAQIERAQQDRDQINARLDRLQDALRIVASDNETQRDLINSMFNSTQQTAAVAYKTQAKVAVIAADAAIKAASKGVSADAPAVVPENPQ